MMTKLFIFIIAVGVFVFVFSPGLYSEEYDLGTIDSEDSQSLELEYGDIVRFRAVFTDDNINHLKFLNNGSEKFTLKCWGALGDTTIEDRNTFEDLSIWAILSVIQDSALNHFDHILVSKRYVFIIPQ